MTDYEMKDALVIVKLQSNHPAPFVELLVLNALCLKSYQFTVKYSTNFLHGCLAAKHAQDFNVKYSLFLQFGVFEDLISRISETLYVEFIRSMLLMMVEPRVVANKDTLRFLNKFFSHAVKNSDPTVCLW